MDGPFARRLAWLPGCVAVALLVACSGGGPPPTPVQPTKVPEADFLVHPLEGYAWSLDPAARERILGAWRQLRSGAASPGQIADVERLLEREPHLQPAIVVLAQRELVAGDDAAVDRLLEPVVEAAPEYTAALVALGRARQRSGRLVQAYTSYRAAADSSPIARREAEGMEAAAREMLLDLFDDAVDRGRYEVAEERLTTLREWSPESVETLRATLRLAAARDDEAAELEALRELVEQEVAEPERWMRLAELEIAVGDLRQGIDLAEDLLAERPNDARLGKILLRGQLAWRLQTAPSEVRALAETGVLSRGELAALLYWLFPEVRYAAADNPPIASDILDHPFRREILRVIDLELIPIDEALHRYEPEDQASRSDVLGALVRSMAAQEPSPPCLAGAGDLAEAGATRPMICRLAAGCGLLESASDCLPAAPVSGREALELFARSVERGEVVDPRQEDRGAE